MRNQLQKIQPLLVLAKASQHQVAGQQKRMLSAAGVAMTLQENNALQIVWQDGLKANLHPQWLRERCLSEETVCVQTKQPKKCPHDIPVSLQVQEAAFASEGYVEVSFNDGHVSQFSLDHLRGEVVDFDCTPIQVPEYKRPQQRLWSGHTTSMPVFHHSSLEQNEEARLAVIEELLTGGQALIRGVPRHEGEVCRFGETLSTLRKTDWGPCFNVRTRPDAEQAKQATKFDLAYTPQPIGFHTDNPYRSPTPDIQLLHAIDHCECAEGHAPCDECSVMNYMVDGFYIAELLRNEDPEAFKLLTEVPVRFENNGGDNGTALVNIAPHFQLDESPGVYRGQLTAIRWSAKSGQYAPPLDPVSLDKFYKARRRFSELAHDAKHTLSLQFTPGDLLIFDNQRILHSRSPISPGDGERWVQGCYIDRDGLWYNYERWRRNKMAREQSGN
jgi:gamma-butyrobetaine dioxygenase